MTTNEYDRRDRMITLVATVKTNQRNRAYRALTAAYGPNTGLMGAYLIAYGIIRRTLRDTA